MSDPIDKPEAGLERAPKGRDRDATERAIVEAAKALIAEAGFSGFGVNAVARRAGYDKQLIYRYFNGLDGLIEAIGADLGHWVRDRVAPSVEAAPASYAALIEDLALGFLDALRADPLVRAIMAWEIADPSPQVMRLTRARSLALVSFMASRRGALTPPAGVDAAMINAVLIAAILIRARARPATGQFAGVALSTDADWERARAAIRHLVRAALA